MRERALRPPRALGDLSRSRGCGYLEGRVSLASLNDPELVRAEYASEAGILGRRGAYDFAEGPDAPEMVFEAVKEAMPSRLLDVGCGPGEFAERFRREIGAEVAAIDLSPRMVELARERGGRRSGWGR